MKASTARTLLNLAERRDIYQDALRAITSQEDCPVHESYSVHLRLKTGPDGVYVNIPTTMLQAALREQIKEFGVKIEELKRGA